MRFVERSGFAVIAIGLSTFVLGLGIYLTSSQGSVNAARRPPIKFPSNAHRRGPTVPTQAPTPAPTKVPTRKPSKPSENVAGQVKIPAEDFDAYTWGYVGCSNTHDTISGYHDVAGTAHLFWPFRNYGIEGKTVPHWENPKDRAWTLYDQMEQQHNGGKDPPVIWIQMCVNLKAGEPNYGPVTYADVVKVIQQVKAHAPNSILFVSPLQSYDPPTLCDMMGPGGDEIPQMTQWLDQAVAQGLANPGPGVSGIPNLGPLTSKTAFRDGCHPNGGPHGPGPGTVFLGEQLAGFFDNLPRS